MLLRPKSDDLKNVISEQLRKIQEGSDEKLETIYLHSLNVLQMSELTHKLNGLKSKDSDKSVSYSNLLIDAAANGLLKKVAQILLYSSTIDSFAPEVDFQDDSSGDTALIKASENGYVDIVSLLLESYANPNIRNYNKETALVKACKNGHLRVVQLLLDGFTKRLPRWNSGGTPVAIFNGSKLTPNAMQMGIAVLPKLNSKPPKPPKSFLKAGFLIENKSTKKKKAQQTTSSPSSSPPTQEKKERNATLDELQLIETTPGRWSPIITASAAGHWHVVEELIRRTNLSWPDSFDWFMQADEQGTTALMVAAANGHLPVVRILCEYAAWQCYKARKSSKKLSPTRSITSESKSPAFSSFSGIIHSPVSPSSPSFSQTLLPVLKKEYPPEITGDSLAEGQHTCLSSWELDDEAEKDEKKKFDIKKARESRIYQRQYPLDQDRPRRGFREFLDQKNKEEWSALMMAAKFGRLYVVHFLVSHGATIDLTEEEAMPYTIGYEPGKRNNTLDDGPDSIEDVNDWLKGIGHAEFILEFSKRKINKLEFLKDLFIDETWPKEIQPFAISIMEKAKKLSLSKVLMDTNLVSTSRSLITRWDFYAETSGVVALQVWRPHRDRGVVQTYELVESTAPIKFNIQEPDIIHVEIREHLMLQAGDLIGVYIDEVESKEPFCHTLKRGVLDSEGGNILTATFTKRVKKGDTVGIPREDKRPDLTATKRLTRLANTREYAWKFYLAPCDWEELKSENKWRHIPTGKKYPIPERPKLDLNARKVKLDRTSRTRTHPVTPKMVEKAFEEGEKDFRLRRKHVAQKKTVPKQPSEDYLYSQAIVRYSKGLSLCKIARREVARRQHEAACRIFAQAESILKPNMLREEHILLKNITTSLKEEAKAWTTHYIAKLTTYRSLKDAQAKRHISLAQQYLRDPSKGDLALVCFLLARSLDPSCSKYFTDDFIEEDGPQQLFSSRLSEDWWSLALEQWLPKVAPKSDQDLDSKNVYTNREAYAKHLSRVLENDLIFNPEQLPPHMPQRHPEQPAWVRDMKKVLKKWEAYIGLCETYDSWRERLAAWLPDVAWYQRKFYLNMLVENETASMELLVTHFGAHIERQNDTRKDDKAILNFLSRYYPDVIRLISYAKRDMGLFAKKIAWKRAEWKK